MEETLQDYHYWWSDLIDKTLRMNSSRDYLIAIGIVLLGLSLIKLSRKIIANRLMGDSKYFGRYLVRIDEYLYPLFYLVVWYGAFSWLTVTEDILLFAFYIFKIGFIFLVIRLIAAVVQNAINSYISRYDANGV